MKARGQGGFVSRPSRLPQEPQAPSKVACLTGKQVCHRQTADGSNQRFEAPRRASARLPQAVPPPSGGE